MVRKIKTYIIKFKNNLLVLAILVFSFFIIPSLHSNTPIIIDTNICYGAHLDINLIEEQASNYQLINSDGHILLEQFISESEINCQIKTDWFNKGQNKFFLKTYDIKSDSIVKEYIINVFVDLQPKPEVIGDSVTCPNQSEVIYSTDVKEGYSYKWSSFGGDIIDNDTNSMVFVNWYVMGKGKLILTKKNKVTHCASTIVKDILIQDIEKPKIISCTKNQVIKYNNSNQFLDIQDESLDIKAIDNCELVSIINDYNFSNTLNGEVIYNPVYIIWTATDKENNTSSCSFDITFKQENILEPPTAFSPNGDGINDTWKINGISMYTNAVIKIHDKYGKLIFESERGYPYEWDGTQKGKELQVDTYYYLIYLDKNTPFLQGNVTILK